MRLAGCVLVCLALAGGPARAEQAFDLEPGTRVLAPIQFRQLSVLPVIESGAATPSANYLTLSDGLKQKLVAVREVAGGGQVNRVEVNNGSKQALLLLGGEVILGGQQDRVLGQDTLLAPGETAMVEVFCVEHGRWSGRRGFDQTAGKMADGKIRSTAKFKKSQQEVWDKVAEKAQALKGQTATGTYRTVAEGAAGEAAVKPYREAVRGALDKLPEKARLIGLIAAINGRVTSVDVFGSPALFAAYRDRLLESIFVSAADVPAAATPAAPPSAAQVRGFIEEAEKAPEKEVDNKALSTTLQKRGKATGKSELKPKAGGKAVYKSYNAME
jgi:hypothetical protein